MAISVLPVDQRVIDIDSRRFASIEKAFVELITNSDDSYVRLENQGQAPAGLIRISYDRRQNSAVLSVTDEAEGMSLGRIRSVLTYGGAHSRLSRGEAGGRGYFGRGMKQAIYGLGHGWIESLHEGRFGRVDLFRQDDGSYVYDDRDGDRPATGKDYERLQIPQGKNGTRVTVIVNNPQVCIPHFRSLLTSATNNIYLRDILQRRTVELLNRNQPRQKLAPLRLRYEEPPADILIGPDLREIFVHEKKAYPFFLTLRKSHAEKMNLKGDERTNGLLILAGTAVLDCQFFRFENQLGTEFLFGTVVCPALAEMLAGGRPVISDERDGLNLREPFVAAFAQAVSDAIAQAVHMERIRLSHVEHASTSKRTHGMIEQILQKMNEVAVNDLGILLPPGPGTGKYGPVPTGRLAKLRFSTPFYYRKVQRPFQVTLLLDRKQFLAQDLLTFTYALPDSIKIEPAAAVLSVGDLADDSRFCWKLFGSASGAKGKITAASGAYSATCEIVIAENSSGQGYHHPSGKPPVIWNQDNSTDMFVGYELRNLDNDIDRAIYQPEERLILINTEAPTVRLYVDGQGRFRDGARLLLAELFLNVIAGEFARHAVDRTLQKGSSKAYDAAKQSFIRRYGADIHQILLGG